MENKPYTMRSMIADDLFAIVKIINKIGLKELKTCFDAAEVKKAMQESNGENKDLAAAVGMRVMMEIAGTVMEHLPECKQDLYSFMASLSGMKAEDIANLSMADFFDMLVDVIKHPDFADFFRRVTGLFS